MMNLNDNNAIARLESLRALHADGLNESAVESRLLREFPTIAARNRGVRGLVSRHRVLITCLALLALAGGGVAGTAAIMWATDYEITISDSNGNVLTTPRIIVADGQSASIQISDPESGEPAIDVTIDASGQVSVNRDDVNVDVQSRPVEIDDGRPIAPPQFIPGSRTFKVRLIDTTSGAELATALVETRPDLGGAMQLVEFGEPIIIRVAPDGTFTCEGCGDRVRVEITEP